MNVGLLGLSYSLAEELLMGEICVMLHVMWEARYIVPTPSIIEWTICLLKFVHALSPQRPSSAYLNVNAWYAPNLWGGPNPGQDGTDLPVSSFSARPWAYRNSTSIKVQILKLQCQVLGPLACPVRCFTKVNLALNKSCLQLKNMVYNAKENWKCGCLLSE